MSFGLRPEDVCRPGGLRHNGRNSIWTWKKENLGHAAGTNNKRRNQRRCFSKGAMPANSITYGWIYVTLLFNYFACSFVCFWIFAVCLLGSFACLLAVWLGWWVSLSVFKWHRGWDVCRQRPKPCGRQEAFFALSDFFKSWQRFAFQRRPHSNRKQTAHIWCYDWKYGPKTLRIYSFATHAKREKVKNGLATCKAEGLTARSCRGVCATSYETCFAPGVPVLFWSETGLVL